MKPLLLSIALLAALAASGCRKQESDCMECTTITDKTSNTSTPGVPSTTVTHFTSCNPNAVIGADTSHVWQGGIRITTIITTTCQ